MAQAEATAAGPARARLPSRLVAGASTVKLSTPKPMPASSCAPPGTIAKVAICSMHYRHKALIEDLDRTADLGRAR